MHDICFGKAYDSESEGCNDCRKKSKKTFNECKMIVLSSLHEPTYSENDNVVRMTLNDDDWDFYCKKVIKRKPKVTSTFGENLGKSRKSRKTKTPKVKSGDTVLTDINISEYFVNKD